MARDHAMGFYRTTVTDAHLGGVCGGVARQVHLGSNLVRVLWILGTLVSFGTGIVVYVVLWVVTPGEESVTGRRPPLAQPGPVYR